MLSYPARLSLSRREPMNKAKATRGNPRLSRELIVREALALLQTLPLAELSMRRLATELGATPAAVYGYFASQDELFDAISTEVLRGITLTGIAEDDDWRSVLRRWAQAVRRR